MSDLRMTSEAGIVRVDLLSAAARSFASELASHVGRPSPDVVTFSDKESVAFVAAARDLGLVFEPTRAFFAASQARADERRAARQAIARRQARASVAGAKRRRR